MDIKVRNRDMDSFTQLVNSVKSVWVETSNMTVSDNHSALEQRIEQLINNSCDTDVATTLSLMSEKDHFDMPLARSNYVDMSVALFILGYIDELKTHTTEELLDAVNRWYQDNDYGIASELTLCQLFILQSESQLAIN
jgi:hypothetical protein